MAITKLHVKKGDTVLVLSGKDKGQQGKVIQALPKKGKVVVEGVNKIKPACGKATRVAHKEVNGKNVRACKKCGEVIDQTK